MPLNGNGTYTPPSPEFPAIPGEDILASDFNTIINDIKGAFETALFRDGQATPTANLPMGNFKLTGLGNGTLDDDAINVKQVADAIAANASSVDPLKAAVAAAIGTSTKAARADHVHPLADSAIPVGSCIPFLGGYFTNGANAGFTSTLGNTAAAVNALLNSKGWYVCNGASLNLAGSPIYNGAGRYLPNLSDDRFFMGNGIAGTIGGDNSSAHTHTLSHTHSITHTHTLSHTHSISHTHTTGSHALTINEIPPHVHSSVVRTTISGQLNDPQYSFTYAAVAGNTGSQGGGASHNHGATGTSSIASSGAASTSTTSAASTGTSGAASTAATSAASATENRPKFLSCIYIQRVI